METIETYQIMYFLIGLIYGTYKIMQSDMAREIKKMEGGWVALVFFLPIVFLFMVVLWPLLPLWGRFEKQKKANTAIEERLQETEGRLQGVEMKNKRFAKMLGIDSTDKT